MAEQKEQVLLEVKFDTKLIDDARTKLAASITAVNQLKKAQSDLNKTIKEQGYATKEQAEELSRIKQQLDQETRSVKSNTAIIQASTQARADENDSLDEQRQYLLTLQKAYANLTKEQKEAMGGQEALEASIKAVSDSLKAQEHAIGDDRRNVGNYTESIEKAFGDISSAAGALGPAVSLLNGMGESGKKAGAALDALSKVLQITGTAGKMVAASTKAQTVATEGQTVAQNGLNVAMAANPIGLIIAGISTLLPLIQAFCDDSADAEKAQKAFNNELERQNKLINQAKIDADFAVQMAAAMGASAKEQLILQQKAAQEAYETAKNNTDIAYEQWRNAKKAERDAAKEHYDEVYQIERDAYARIEQLGREMEILNAKERHDAEVKEEEDRKAAWEKKQAEKWDEAAYEKAQERQIGIEMMEARLALADIEKQALLDKERELMEESKALLASMDEEEETDEDILSPEDQARKMWGLDSEGLAYFKELLAQGVSFSEAKTKAITEQTIRMTKAWATSFNNLGGAFTDMGDMLGEFSEDSKEAANAQKGFTLTGIILNQASAISNGALAIAEGTASAASLPFPANIPAIITIVAQIAALMAGVGTSIAQAKKLFSEADSGKFAEGGIVGGSSYSGDRMIAHVNSREMILPMDAQQNLFDALSSGNGSNRSLGIDYEMMAAAVSAQPAPVVVYSELQEFGDKVTTYNEIASI